MKDFHKLIKNRNFVSLWISQFMSQVSVYTLNFLVILKIFEKTGSSVATSLVWIVFILPAILIGPFAATYVDFENRKKILVFTNFGQFLILLLLAVSQERVLYLSYGMVFIYSILNQFYIPAEVASLPSLVKKEYLPQANGLFLGTYQLGLIFGSVLSGMIVELLGFSFAFAMAALMVLIAFFSVLAISSKKLGGKLEQGMLVNNFFKLYKGVFEGMKFIKNDKRVFLPFLTISFLQVLLAIIFVSIPAISSNLLGINPNYSGIFVVGPAVLGAIVGIVSISKIHRSVRSMGGIKATFALLATASWTTALVLKLIPLPYRLIVSIITDFMIGVAFISLFITAQTQLQVVTPQNYLGRVFGNSWFITTVATVFPMLFSASIIEIFGIRGLFVLLGIFFSMIVVFYDKLVGIKTKL